jgi:hypothetical protein
MFVSALRLKSFLVFSFATIAVGGLLSLSSCKEEEKPEPPPPIIGSPTPDGRILNEITISRSDNSQIIISFVGSELGEFELPNADTLNRCKFIDASDRVFKSDTGLIVINDYYVKDGIVNCSGGFNFEGDFINPTTFITTNGGFVNIKSN